MDEQRPSTFDFVAPRLAIGAICVSPDDVRRLAGVGFTHVVNCSAELDQAAIYAQVAPEVVYLWNPTDDDGSRKPLGWFDTTVDFTRRALEHGDAQVLIYCVGGLNRAPSAAYAVLRELYGYSPDDASKAIRVARPSALVAYAADYEHHRTGNGHGCLLCEAAPATRRYAEDDVAWVADCATCDSPMVVWKQHGTTPGDADHVHMLAMLDDAAAQRYPGTRWLIDQHRRSIPDHFHAHARPLRIVEDDRWARIRPVLRRLASQRTPVPTHGWRAWTVDPDGNLRSQERQAVWPARRHRAICDAPDPCPTAPTLECFCGLAVFGTLHDAVACYGTDAPMGQLVWGAVTVEGDVLRDHGLVGATWRCQESELVALVTGPTGAAVADRAALEAIYGVPVRVAADDTAAAVIAAADGLPAVGQPAVDLYSDVPCQVAGEAWTTRGIGRTLISMVPERDRDASPVRNGVELIAGVGGRGSARFTWYRPGVHRLALTADECDDILAAVSSTAVTPYGRQSGIIPRTGDGRWVWERAQNIMVAANLAWWRLVVDQTTGVVVNTYRPGDGLPWHTDNTPVDATFRLSLVAMLSDPADYTGGRLEFRHDEEPTGVAQARGTVFVFPSTLLHHVTPLVSGERKVLVAFANAAELPAIT